MRTVNTCREMCSTHQCCVAAVSVNQIQRSERNVRRSTSDPPHRHIAGLSDAVSIGGPPRGSPQAPQAAPAQHAVSRFDARDLDPTDTAALVANRAIREGKVRLFIEAKAAHGDAKIFR